MDNLSANYADRVIQLNDKFECFITGGIGGLFFYLIQNFKPERLSLSPNTLTLLSIILLIISVIVSLIRIEKQILIYQNNYSLLVMEDDSEEIVRALNENNPSHYQSITREVLFNDDLERLHNKNTIKIKNLQKFVIDLNRKAAHYYKFRTIFLSCGIVCYFIAKIWLPYHS